jgi:hypothetical protein
LFELTSIARASTPTSSTPAGRAFATQIYGNLGAIFRMAAISSDFGSPHIRPSLPGLQSFNPTSGFNWYLFGRRRGPRRRRDIFLDG